ncbi:MAG TPA: hypothetical protein VFO51_01055 [Sphingomicrobium sp.]|nr:hypothetical protein [Sphingomicrobium sp.]
MRWSIAAAALFLDSGQAQASGGLWCDASDKAATIAINSGVTRGLGGPLFNFAGTVGVLDPSVPADLRTTLFETAHVPQYWLDGSELRLLLYRERAGNKAHGYVELTIIAKAGDDGAYEGRYTLDLFDAQGASSEGMSWKFEGAISCGAE